MSGRLLPRAATAVLPRAKRLPHADHRVPAQELGAGGTFVLRVEGRSAGQRARRRRIASGPRRTPAAQTSLSRSMQLDTRPTRTTAGWRAVPIVEYDTDARCAARVPQPSRGDSRVDADPGVRGEGRCVVSRAVLVVLTSMRLASAWLRVMPSARSRWRRPLRASSWMLDGETLWPREVVVFRTHARFAAPAASCCDAALAASRRVLVGCSCGAGALERSCKSLGFAPVLTHRLHRTEVAHCLAARAQAGVGCAPATRAPPYSSSAARTASGGSSLISAMRSRSTPAA
jgi:hypothetical protein